jgi:tetratricopeptide (TPR) repeat protein
VASGATFRSFAQSPNQGLSAFPHLQRHLQVIGDNDGVPLDKSEAYAYYNRAIAYLNLQRYPEARQNLQQAANLYRQKGSNNISQRIIDFMNQLPN